MPILSTGNTFTASEQITSTKLNNIANGADFTDTSGNAVDSSGTTGTCVNGGGIEVTTGGQLQVKDDGITSAKLDTNIDIAGTLDVTSTLTADSNVNISGNLDVDGTLEFDSLSGTGSVSVTDILDQNNMSSNSATALATQQSIKAYVDTEVSGTITSDTAILPSGLILKYGTGNSTSNGDQTFNFSSLTSGSFPNNCFFCIAVQSDAGGGQSLPVTSLSKTSFTVNRDDAVSNTGFRFMAIGN